MNKLCCIKHCVKQCVNAQNTIVNSVCTDDWIAKSVIIAVLMMCDLKSLIDFGAIFDSYD